MVNDIINDVIIDIIIITTNHEPHEDIMDGVGGAYWDPVDSVQGSAVLLVPCQSVLRMLIWLYWKPGSHRSPFVMIRMDDGVREGQTHLVVKGEYCR